MGPNTPALQKEKETCLGGALTLARRRVALPYKQLAAPLARRFTPEAVRVWPNVDGHHADHGCSKRARGCRIFPI